MLCSIVTVVYIHSGHSVLTSTTIKVSRPPCTSASPLCSLHSTYSHTATAASSKATAAPHSSSGSLCSLSWLLEDVRFVTPPPAPPPVCAARSPRQPVLGKRQQIRGRRGSRRMEAVLLSSSAHWGQNGLGSHFLLLA